MMRSAPSLGFAVVVILTTACGQPNRVDSLAQEIGPSRGIEGRLVGVAHHRPFRPSAAIRIEQLSRRALADYSALADATLSDRDLIAAAEAELVLGRGDAALVLLSQAIQADPQSVRAWVALSAAHLGQSPDPGTPQIVDVQALEAALNAVQIDAGSGPGWFNLALASHRLGLSTQAQDAWGRAAGLESDPYWRQEIAERRGRRVELLSQVEWSTEAASLAILQRESGGVREWFLTDLLPTLGDAHLERRRDDVIRLHGSAERLARVLEAIDGDRQWSGCVAALAPRVGASVTQRAARGHVEYASGRRLYEENRRDDAVKAFRRAASDLEGAQSPCADWASLQLGLAQFQAADVPASLATYESVADRAERKGFHSLLARARWLSGISLVTLGRGDEALEAFQQTYGLFERARDRTNLAFAANAAADGLRTLGAHREGWSHLARVLTHPPAEHRRRYVTYFNAALYAAEMGFPRAALAFQNEALVAALARGAANSIVEARVHRARFHLALGDRDAALADIKEASSLLPSITATSSRTYLEAWLTWARALTAEDSAQAYDVIDESLIARFAARERIYVPQLLLAKARAAARAGRSRAAERTYLAGIEALKDVERRLSREEHRVALLDARWNLFGELIQLVATELRDPDQAFIYAEAFRNSSGTGPDDRRLAPEQIASALGKGEGIVTFLVLDEQVLSWRLSRNNAEFISIPVRREALARLVLAWRESIEKAGRSPVDSTLGKSLYSMLIGDGWVERTGIERLTIVADGPLHALPLASLIEPTTGRYLIESVSVAMGETAMAGLDRPKLPVAPAAMRLLGIAPDDGADSRRPGLPGAANEARYIRGRYPTSTVLSGPAATLSALRRESPRFEILHFAGHAEADLDFPWASYLALWPDRDSPRGRMHPADIESLPLPSTSLVVLGACRTGLGRVFRGAGVLSLARPFLRAGVPNVVASLWDISDGPAGGLLSEFHRRFSQTGDAVGALRDAQLASLRGPDPTSALPGSWAGLVVITGRHR